MPLVVLSTILVTRVTGWQKAGFTRPGQWRQPRLYALPTVVVLAPLAAGVTPVAPGMLAMLITGYALTGYMEEAMWRGVVLRVLRPTGTMQAVLIGSLLFGAAHLSHIMFRALVAAQARQEDPAGGRVAVMCPGRRLGRSTAFRWPRAGWTRCPAGVPSRAAGAPRRPHGHSRPTAVSNTDAMDSGQPRGPDNHR